MRNKILKNRGMLLENLIERTSIYCDEKGFYIEKRNLPIKILRKENKYIKGKIIGLATIDYFGFKDGKYFEIEAKQTEDNYFNKSNLRKEQIEWTKIMENRGITVYLMVMFSQDLEIYITTIKEVISYKKSKIEKEWFIDSAEKIDIITPGVLDLSKKIK